MLIITLQYIEVVFKKLAILLSYSHLTMCYFKIFALQKLNIF